ncbi:hypothetical protein [Leptospira interrogans]|uniref:hypothetical protein n=1 Tax=Leptospira interrogans TaxID=173 RepID=UPI000278379B|nr:hypothetical protein [Leptospira interrogans]EJP02250.1 hypothetical protein LEP1GSC007_0844 [Leptospira interrogans serovar Bulgarica str. Mallika]EKO88136.1 hypothetical protein LEP1GSC009_3456 [Leptospira interrogans serovar Grippotyphosa str. Andaman]EKP86348.1 hypothetical protein LEP1GSC020_3519 [Leptospira interrogans serovar Grippotyphosa str. 2006006986]QCO32069.1 hypothetical protein E4414_02385 [Leptospira interrogans]UID83913.1 hypothetical protein J9305_02625 [Leptospira interr
MRKILVLLTSILLLTNCSSKEIKETPTPSFNFTAYQPTNFDEIVKVAKNINETEKDLGVSIINARVKFKYKLPKLPTKVDKYGAMALGANTIYLQTSVKLEDIFSHQLSIPSGKFKVNMYFQKSLVAYTLANARFDLYFYVLFASYNNFDNSISLLVNVVNNEAHEMELQKERL